MDSGIGEMTRRLANFKVATVVTVCLLVQAAESHAGDWSQWGGPNRNFMVNTRKLANMWPQGGPKRLWRRPLGAGYSSIVVADGKLYTMYRDGKNDVVACLRAENGDTAWEHKYPAPIYPGNKSDFGNGPNATPLLLKDRIITIGFTGKMTCLSLDKGTPLWSHDLIKEFGGKIQEFGYSASPIAYKNVVIVLVGGKKHGVIAFSPKDGSVVWQSASHDISYASPIVINVDGQDQIVFMSSIETIGIDAANGTFLWSHPCVNQYKNNATDPIWGKDNLLWVATQMDGGTRVLKLRQRDGKTTVKQVWFNRKVKVFHWNAIRIGDYVYASIGSNTTTISAVNVKTGEIAWRERGFHKALCVYADNKLIFLDENGQLAMAKISPEKIDILSKVQLTDKVSWTVPTLVGKILFIRDKKEIMALDLG